MFTDERQKEILEILRERNSETVKALAKELFVSEATVRRDLIKMETSGLIRRAHGGATAERNSSEESALYLREEENSVAKRTIARIAMNYVSDNGSAYMDSSTTVGMLIPYMSPFQYLTVITDGLQNAAALALTSGAKIYIVGGRITNKSCSVLGEDAIDFLSNTNADVALISCRGVDAEHMITDSSIEQARIKREMIKRANKVILLCDSSKFGQVFLSKLCDFSEIDYFICEKSPEGQLKNVIEKSGCNIISSDKNFF